MSSVHVPSSVVSAAAVAGVAVAGVVVVAVAVADADAGALPENTRISLV